MTFHTRCASCMAANMTSKHCLCLPVQLWVGEILLYLLCLHSACTCVAPLLTLCMYMCGSSAYTLHVYTCVAPLLTLCMYMCGSSAYTLHVHVWLLCLHSACIYMCGSLHSACTCVEWGLFDFPRCTGWFVVDASISSNTTTTLCIWSYKTW